VAVSFIGGGNQSTEEEKKSSTCRKSLTNFNVQNLNEFTCSILLCPLSSVKGVWH